MFCCNEISTLIGLWCHTNNYGPTELVEDGPISSSHFRQSLASNLHFRQWEVPKYNTARQIETRTRWIFVYRLTKEQAVTLLRETDVKAAFAIWDALQREMSDSELRRMEEQATRFLESLRREISERSE